MAEKDKDSRKLSINHMTNALKQELLKEYEDKEQLYAEFASLVRNLLQIFLDGQGFKFQISHRAKEKCKLAEKIDRKNHEGKQYTKLEDVEDLAGVRIVFYLESDKKRFLNLFLNEFNNCIVSREEKYTPKGYRGFHIIFCLDDKRLALVEYQKYKGLKCELQISTILFHAWSEVEHDIIYKPKGDPVLLRTLGLDEIEKIFEKLMIEHIQAATIQLDYINKKYEEIRKAGEILSADFVNDVINSKTNDEIYGKLEVIEKFYYKKPDETLAIIEAVLKHKPLKSAIIHRFKDGVLYGKKHKDIILKSIDLLSSIRYYKPNEILDLLSTFSLSEDKDIKNKALGIVKKFSQYDYNVLTKSKIGYGAQRKALDFILAWSREEQLRHIDFVETILRELLSSSVEGTTSGLNENADYTITMHFGAVSPTDFLKKMRRETIDFVYELYKSAGDPKLKLKLVEILDETTRTPSNVAYGEDVSQMIADDLKYLISVYRKIIFEDGDDKMTNNLGIVATIEQRLYWINKSETRKVEESEKLREEILQNDLYQLFRLLVGDLVTYKEEEGWDVAEKKRNEKINTLISSITEAQLEAWFDKLNRVASQYILIEDWQFNIFKFFIRKLSEAKPQVAEKLLEKASRDNAPLKHFMSSFLDGFRIGAHFAQWDKFTNEIIDAKDSQFINAVVFSLNLPPDADLDKLIREDDIDLLENIAREEDRLIFLKGIGDRVLHYALINTLGRNFRRSPKRIEPLIIEELENNPEYLNMFFAQLPMMIHSKWFDVKELQPETIKLLQEKIIELPNIDWHIQEVLLAIGEHDGLNSILDVFMKRIEKDAVKKEKIGRHLDERYEVIPYHFNPDLEKFIAEHPDYEKVTSGWVARMTTDWSIYNWHVSHFLQRVGKGFGKILISLIQKGGDENLMKAARAMHSIDSVDFDICIEIIRRTDNKNIIDLVGGNMYATGVVSGEYGIAEAYEKKAKRLEKYKGDESERVKIFVDRMIKSFQESAERERQQADEEKQLRKIEFDG